MHADATYGAVDEHAISRLDPREETVDLRDDMHAGGREELLSSRLLGSFLNLDDLMITSRQQTQNWVDEYLKPRYPDLVEPFWAALDGYEQIISNGHVLKDFLDYFRTLKP